MNNKFKTFRYQTKIIESHLDTFGHVNNAKYLELFEEARWDFITEQGYGMDVITAKNIGPVILGVEVKFKKELKNRERIEITSQTTKIRNPIMVLHQEILRDGIVCAEADFTVALFDLKERKMVAPTNEWLKAIGCS